MTGLNSFRGRNEGIFLKFELIAEGHELEKYRFQKIYMFLNFASSVFLLTFLLYLFLLIRNHISHYWRQKNAQLNIS